MPPLKSTYYIQLSPRRHLDFVALLCSGYLKDNAPLINELGELGE